jgi:hypothetical protein
LVDVDGDGIRDLLSGSYSRMETPMAGLFQVLWGQQDGSFKTATTLAGTDGEPLIIPADDEKEVTQKICTRPSAVDWDGDGDLDLIVGNFAGSFYLFSGDGEGRFQPKPQPILAAGEPLAIPGAHSDPFPVDWDGDGDLDLVSGSSGGGVYWAENQAGPGTLPDLKSFVVILEPGSQRAHGAALRDEDVSGPGPATRVWVDDVNEDGKLDLLIGDSVMLVSPAEGLTEEECKQKEAQWQQALDAVMRDVNDAQNDEQRSAAYDRYREVYQQRREFVHEERTGFVWLVLQK